MLAISLRVLPRFTHSCLREYSQVSTANVGMSLALAISVPMLGASRVGMSLALATSVPTLGVACVLTRGEGG